MPDTQARIEALRWAAASAQYCADEAAHAAQYHRRKGEGRPAVLSEAEYAAHATRCALLNTMADELEEEATP